MILASREAVEVYLTDLAPLRRALLALICLHGGTGGGRGTNVHGVTYHQRRNPTVAVVLTYSTPDLYEFVGQTRPSCLHPSTSSPTTIQHLGSRTFAPF